MRWDVNNDGHVTPGDALIIINALSSMGPHALETVNLVSGVPWFLDVSGDGFVAPDDVLSVINPVASCAIACLRPETHRQQQIRIPSTR